MSKAAELAALIGSQSSLSNRNMIINGDMAVAQRATSATGLGASTGYHTVDRHHTEFTTSGRMTQSQAAITDLPGFKYALKCDCTTADTSVDAAEYTLINHKMEGYTVNRLASGTSSAKSSTVSFYVKGNASATYVLELIKAGDRHINKTFSVTTSWSRVSITFDGDTTTQLAQDNTQELSVNIWLHAGSNYTSGSLQTSWGSYVAANRAVGISSFFDSTDREIFITGWQYELGEVATPFKHESYGDNLARCQRYYYLAATAGTDPMGTGSWYGSTEIDWFVKFPVTMRAKPSLEATSGTNYYRSIGSNTYDDFNGVAISNDKSIEGAYLYATNAAHGASGTQGDASIVIALNASAKVALLAEL
jgi:hypothetical protein